MGEFLELFISFQNSYKTEQICIVVRKENTHGELIILTFYSIGNLNWAVKKAPIK